MQVVGLIGFEPMTLRLSSACSNQLSYRPMGLFDVRFQMYDLHLTSSISLLALKDGGGTGIRTPDIQLAKLALYQLSYTPGKSLTSPLRGFARRLFFIHSSNTG